MSIFSKIAEFFEGLNTVRNYGLLEEDIIQGKHYVLGGYNKADFPIVNESGDWEKYAPVPENQNSKTVFFDSRNCVNYGTNNAREAYAKFAGLDDYPKDQSERYGGITTGTTQNGNYPHVVAEVTRTWSGAIPESLLPFTDAIKDWFGYYSPNPMDPALLAIGQALLKKFKLPHAWVFNTKYDLTVKEKQEMLMDALKRGTIGISVLAWKKDKRTKLYRKGRGESDTHWVWLVKGVPKKYWLIFDSYDETFKKLEWDYNFVMAKIYKIERIAPQPEPAMDKRDILYKAAYASLGKDMSDRAPNELGCADSVNNVYQKAFGSEIGGGVSTKLMYETLLKDKRFIEVRIPQKADIIISPTSYSTKGAKNGHVGIVGKNNAPDGTLYVMSNDSFKGTWEANYSVDSWKKYFGTKLGFPVKFFRLV